MRQSLRKEAKTARTITRVEHPACFAAKVAFINFMLLLACSLQGLAVQSSKADLDRRVPGWGLQGFRIAFVTKSEAVGSRVDASSDTGV